MDTYPILKCSNTSKGCHPNSRTAFSLLKVSESVIFFSRMELIGACFPMQSPIHAKAFANP